MICHYRGRIASRELLELVDMCLLLCNDRCVLMHIHIFAITSGQYISDGGLSPCANSGSRYIAIWFGLSYAMAFVHRVMSSLEHVIGRYLDNHLRCVNNYLRSRLGDVRYNKIYKSVSCDQYNSNSVRSVHANPDTDRTSLKNLLLMWKLCTIAFYELKKENIPVFYT